VWVSDTCGANEIDAPIIGLHSRDDIMNTAFANLCIEQSL
jgi:hypothetical protein